MKVTRKGALKQRIWDEKFIAPRNDYEPNRLGARSNRPARSKEEKPKKEDMKSEMDKVKLLANDKHLRIYIHIYAYSI